MTNVEALTYSQQP